MMEFTFNGVVRHGFGFYNPNHAAAFICAIFPFLSGWQKYKWLSYILMFFLVICLTLTYSRTGIVVLFIELSIYFLLKKIKNYKLILGVFAIFFLITLCFGVFARFQIDKSLINRPLIWIAGAKLFAINPLGVGIGNSGKIVSTFLLNGINCRTLINSHLTLLVEFGIIGGFVWISLIFYAILKGIKKTRAWTSFIGLNISAFMATIFDWHILFDFYDFGKLSLINFVLSWITFLFFIGLLIFLILGKFSLKNLLISIMISLIIICSCFMFYSSQTPKIKNHFIIKIKNDLTPLILYDDTWQIKDILQSINRDDYIIPLNYGYHFFESKRVYLLGNMSEYFHKFKNKQIIYIR